MKKFLVLASLFLAIAVGLYVLRDRYNSLGESLRLPGINDTPESSEKEGASIKTELDEKISLPEGFSIDYYAQNVPNARSLVISESGIVYVGSRSAGNVYALVDADGDKVAEEVVTVISRLNSPNGVAILEGDLYIAEISRIIVIREIDTVYRESPDYEVIYDNYPIDPLHGWKYIAFGPDEKLYIPIGAPCNVCDRDDENYSVITRISPDGEDFEVVARGIRNTVGFDWHPDTNQLWFTDNGRDWLGDDIPPDELNVIDEDEFEEIQDTILKRDSELKREDLAEEPHYGFPYCFGSGESDPEYGTDRNCDDYVGAKKELGPHVAALGMTFFREGNFPESYQNIMFIAEHGSWNRTDPIGYRVMQVEISEEGEALSYEPFAEGWLVGSESWGRPVDVVFMQDGSLLISDDAHNAVYRVRYIIPVDETDTPESGENEPFGENDSVE